MTVPQTLRAVFLYATAHQLRRRLRAHPTATAWALYLLSLVPLLLCLQLVHGTSPRYLLSWPIRQCGPFLVNLGLLILALGLLYALVNSAFDALAVLAATIVVLGCADRAKISKLQLPLFPSDFLFVRELANLDAYYTPMLAYGAGGLLATIGFGRHLRKRLPHLRTGWPQRALILALGIGSLACAVPHHLSLIEALNRLTGTRNYTWNPTGNYRHNGVLYGLLLNLDGMLVATPPGYSRESVSRILGGFQSIPGRPGQRANVILVMSESFWDLRELKGLDLDFDPTPTYRALVENGFGFHLVTPTFGGGTCDPEFEVLTGLPVKYFPPGSRAYQQYVQRPIPSIARLFKHNGYRAAAVHTHYRWYWNRDRVYKFAGFDSFTGIEDMSLPERKGLYASDRQLVKALVEKSRRTTEPYFLFAISVQNHGPYDRDRYDRYDHPVRSGMLSPTATTELRNYSQGLIDADSSLRELVAFVDGQQAPTVLVFFGDHLPSTGALFADTGFFSDSLSPLEDRMRRYVEVGVVHANFDIPRPHGRLFSTAYLPLYIAELAGVERPAFYAYLAELQARLPGLSRELTLDAYGKPLANDDPAMRAVDASYWQLEYDVLFGANYSGPFFDVRAPVAGVTRRSPVSD